MSNINIKPFYSKGYENAELIKVTTNEQGQQLVSGRELHETLKVQTDFTNWMKSQLSNVDAVENEDYTRFAFKREANNATLYEYILTLDIAKEICMCVGVAPRTNEETRQLSKQVRKYFIQCEKALHNPYANLSPELQMLIKLEQGQTELNQRVGDLENNMTIDYSQQETLRLAISTRVYQLLGNAKENAKLRSKVYSNLHRCIKKQFSVNSYKNIAVKEFENAKAMITVWMPDEIMMLAIQGAKSQMSLM
ncbi:ORF6C domain-containing protein [Turicibacter sanguinis]|uniref:ORF6C domain-containing protein n=1 Tax=Turicibacter sanguinis TaxID=154288 RepID=UPI0021D48DE6|nr:ORF6C domain-containing protein [Turicibacter sanguinis]MCU7201367.1 ORF6C domain-containing protein [Turicibacter sanguinis]